MSEGILPEPTNDLEEAEAQGRAAGLLTVATVFAGALVGFPCALLEVLLSIRRKRNDSSIKVPVRAFVIPGICSLLWVGMDFSTKNALEKSHRVGPKEDGKKDGLVTEWHENGQKKGEAIFKDGKKDGRETVWHENGQKEWEGTYKDGKLHGLWTWWDKDGQKVKELTYKDGEFHGLSTWWDENGNETRKVTFRNGELVK